MSAKAMSPNDVVRAAIPDADQGMCEHIVWGRTPFPFKAVSARELYKAASRVQRAHRNGITLCMFCDNIAEAGDTECATCAAALDRCRKEMGHA